MTTNHEIETIVQAVDDNRVPLVSLKHKPGVFQTYKLSDDIVQERIDGFASFDSLIILQDDITKLVDFLDEPSDLPSGMTVFARPCRADLIWGTTFNYREDLNPDGYSGWVPDGHGITSERRPPYEHPNVELILDLTREPEQLYDR